MSSYCVYVKFRVAADVSALNKDKIIWALPGTYKVSRIELQDMDTARTYREFPFADLTTAKNFANRLFESANDVLDIKTNFAG